MPELVLYRSNGSCAIVPHIVLRELGIPFKGVHIGWGNGLILPEGMTLDDYLKIQPSGYVPGLTVDGVAVSENPAILTYIASLAPERNLAGKTDLDRAHVASWLSFLSGSAHGWAFGMIFAPRRFTDDESQYDAIRTKGWSKAHEFFARIDKALGGRDFLVGDAETLADFYIYVFYKWALKFDVDMSPYPNFARSVKRLETKESVRAVCEIENQKLAFQ